VLTPGATIRARVSGLPVCSNFISCPCCFRVIPGVNLTVLGSFGSPSGLPILARDWLHLPSSEETGELPVWTMLLLIVT
jgi:hypothetical protein